MMAINELYPEPFRDLDVDAGRDLYRETLRRTQGDEPAEADLWDTRRWMTWNHFRKETR